jgi:hypothetical protein
MEKYAFTRGSFYVVFRSLILEDIFACLRGFELFEWGSFMIYLEIKVCNVVGASQIGLVHILEAAATPPISGTREVSLLHTL